MSGRRNGDESEISAGGVAEILRALGRIEGQLIGVQIEQTRIADCTLDMTTRITALEMTNSRSLGWAAGVAACVTAGVTIVWNIVKSIV